MPPDDLPDPDEPAPYHLVGHDLAELECCDRPWQHYRDGSRNYTICLSGPRATPLVTTAGSTVLRIDPPLDWPWPAVIAHQPT